MENLLDQNQITFTPEKCKQIAITRLDLLDNFDHKTLDVKGSTQKEAVIITVKNISVKSNYYCYGSESF